MASNQTNGLCANCGHIGSVHWRQAGMRLVTSPTGKRGLVADPSGIIWPCGVSGCPCADMAVEAYDVGDVPTQLGDPGCN